MNYDLLVQSINGQNKDWEILEIPIDKVIVNSFDKHFGKKLHSYKRMLKNNQILPPLVLDPENRLIDGEHRFMAMDMIGFDKVPVIRQIGEGTGKVLKDTYFKNKRGEFRLMYKNYADDEFVTCLQCQKRLDFMPDRTSTCVAEFPEGLPVGPYFYCKNCGLIINKYRFIVWHSLA